MMCVSYSIAPFMSSVLLQFFSIIICAAVYFGVLFIFSEERIIMLTYSNRLCNTIRRKKESV